MITTIAKRIQSRLSRSGVKVSLAEIKEQCEQTIKDIDNPSEIELIAVQEYFINAATSLTVINDVSDVHTQSIPDIDSNSDDDINTLSIQNIDSNSNDGDSAIAPLSNSNKSELVANTAGILGIVLDNSEISLIAENINHSSDDFDQDIDAIKAAIMAFIDHKSMINQLKINTVIQEIREVVGNKNTENSRLLSSGLHSINSDIQEANKQFKSNAQKCLAAFAIPVIKAG